MGKMSRGKSTAQGGTPHKMSKPEGNKGNLKDKFKTGKKNLKAGGSPLDGRGKG